MFTAVIRVEEQCYEYHSNCFYLQGDGAVDGVFAFFIKATGVWRLYEPFVNIGTSSTLDNVEEKVLSLMLAFRSRRALSDLDSSSTTVYVITVRLADGQESIKVTLMLLMFRMSSIVFVTASRRGCIRGGGDMLNSYYGRVVRVL